MTAWVMSIIGVCFLSVVVDLTLPDGKTNLLIKKIVSYVVVAVVLIPLTRLVGNKQALSEIFSYSEIEIQDNYIYNINQSKIDALTKDINLGLEEKGILGVGVNISADVFSDNLEIFAIYVDLYNMVISENLKNKDIQTEVVSVVLSCVNISKEKIIFYE